MAQENIPEYVVDLKKRILRAFNVSELQELCFELLIDYESLVGNNINVKIQHLILHFHRRNEISRLIEICKKHRPKIIWTAFDSIQGVESSENQIVGDINISKGENFRNLLGMLKTKSPYKEQFTILITGRTGVGKTFTVSRFLGSEIGYIGDSEPVTRGLDVYSLGSFGNQFLMVDTPGLSDLDGDDQVYLQLLNSKAPTLDCLWLLKEMNSYKFSVEETHSFELLMKAYGESIWQKCIVILTKADQIALEDYSTLFLAHTQNIRAMISKYCGAKIVESVPIIAATNINPHTPDGRTWLLDLNGLTMLKFLSES